MTNEVYTSAVQATLGYLQQRAKDFGLIVSYAPTLEAEIETLAEAIAKDGPEQLAEEITAALRPYLYGLYPERGEAVDTVIADIVSIIWGEV